MRNALKLIGFISLVATVGIGDQIVAPYSQAAIAQTAQAAPADSNGDFNTAIMSGNIGNFYPTSRWLVMPQGSLSLNCRESPNGRVVSRLMPGSVVQAKFNGPLQLGGRGSAINTEADAIDLSIGKPWLRITGTGDFVLPISRDQPGETQIGECYVRANLQYIAPISEDVEVPASTFFQ